jgi:multiple sugar transport system substrate-binding protein
VISTHTKYAPSQRQWLTPLDDDLDDEELEPFTPRTLKLARMDGSLYSVPRNLDVKLLLYRTDLMEDKPSSWEDLLETATRLRSDNLYGFAFPGKESGLFGHFFELHAMAGGRMFGMKVRPLLAWTMRQATGRSVCSRIFTRGPLPQRPWTGTTMRSQPASVKARQP